MSQRTCKLCGGRLAVLGSLGWLLHLNCIQCGAHTNVAIRASRRGQMYRVVTFDGETRDGGKRTTVMFGGTRAQCKQFVTGRWGCCHAFATITTRTENFHLCRF